METPVRLPVTSSAPVQPCSENQADALYRAGFVVLHEIEDDGRIAVRLRNVSGETKEVRRVGVELTFGECGKPSSSCLQEPVTRVGQVPPDGGALIYASPPADAPYACTTVALGVLVWLDKGDALCVDAGGWTATAAGEPPG